LFSVIPGLQFQVTNSSAPMRAHACKVFTQHVMAAQVNNVFTYQLTATPALDVAIEVTRCRVGQGDMWRELCAGFIGCEGDLQQHDGSSGAVSAQRTQGKRVCLSCCVIREVAAA